MTYNPVSGPLPPECDASKCDINSEWMDIFNGETFCYVHVPNTLLDKGNGLEYVGDRLNDWLQYK